MRPVAWASVALSPKLKGSMSLYSSLGVQDLGFEWDARVTRGVRVTTCKRVATSLQRGHYQEEITTTLEGEVFQKSSWAKTGRKGVGHYNPKPQNPQTRMGCRTTPPFATTPWVTSWLGLCRGNEG